MFARSSPWVVMVVMVFYRHNRRVDHWTEHSSVACNPVHRLLACSLDHWAQSHGTGNPQPVQNQHSFCELGYIQKSLQTKNANRRISILTESSMHWEVGRDEVYFSTTTTKSNSKTVDVETLQSKYKERMIDSTKSTTTTSRRQAAGTHSVSNVVCEGTTLNARALSVFSLCSIVFFSHFPFCFHLSHTIFRFQHSNLVRIFHFSTFEMHFVCQKVNFFLCFV